MCRIKVLQKLSTVQAYQKFLALVHYLQCISTNSNGFMRRVYYFLITLLFLALSILGGSRGDALGVLIIGFLYYLSIRPIGLPVYLILCFLLLSIFISDWLWLEELVFVSRLLVILDGDYGLRDLLFLQAINVLDYEKSCAMFGCGFGFFSIILAMLLAFILIISF